MAIVSEAALRRFYRYEGIKEALRDGGVPKEAWQDRAIAAVAVRGLVKEQCGDDPKRLTKSIFKENGMSELLIGTFGGSTYRAAKESGYEVEQWQMANGCPRLYFDSQAERVRAVRWLADRCCAGDPTQLSTKLFQFNGLGGLLYDKFGNSPYKAAAAAYPERNLRPEEMYHSLKSLARPKERWGRPGPEALKERFDSYAKIRATMDAGYMPAGSWQVKEIAVIAVKGMVGEECGGDPKRATNVTFEESGLTGLLTGRYKGSAYRAVKEAGYEVEPWEMAGGTPRRHFDSREERARAVRWLADRCCKGDPTQLSMKLFYFNGLAGLLYDKYGNSPYRAVAEAYPERNLRPEDMADMPRPSTVKKENERLAADKGTQ